MFYFYFFFVFCLQQGGVADWSPVLIEVIAIIILLSSYMYIIFLCFVYCSVVFCILYLAFLQIGALRSALIEVIGIIILGQCSNSAAVQKNNWSHCHYHRLTFLQLLGTTQYAPKTKTKNISLSGQGATPSTTLPEKQCQHNLPKVLKRKIAPWMQLVRVQMRAICFRYN